MANITKQMEQSLAPEHLRQLRAAGSIASREGMRLFLVGGVVRDLLLGNTLLDLDLVVEGSAATLARYLAAELGVQITARSQFGTLKLKTASTTVDLATARSESYAHPGALPAVRPASITEDLARRDFTINALAVGLAPAEFGEMIDLCGGERDLASRRVRVLHERSFQDDATRILRASRYEQRLGFRMDRGTEALARRDVRSLRTISPDRLHRELARCLEEPRPELCLARLGSLGALQAIAPFLSWPPTFTRALTALRADGQQAEPLLCLALLALPLTPAQGQALAKRLNLSGLWLQVVQHTLLLNRRLSRLGRQDLAPSAAYRLLKDLDPAAIQAARLAARSPARVRGRLASYLEVWRPLRPSLTARDLLAMGVPQGPLVGRLLERLLALRLDYPNATVADERKLVHRALTSYRLRQSGRRRS